MIWGFYLTAVCLLGMSLMWGRCRHSPTTALAFTILWTLTTVLNLAVAALWFYFFYATRAVRVDACRSKTVRAGRLLPNFAAPRRMAPKERINACIRMASSRGSELFAYGVVHILMGCLCAVVIFWARDYHARLLEIEEFERLQDEAGVSSEKVGLLIGTAPLGMRSRRTSPPAPQPPAQSPARPQPLRMGSNHSVNDRLAVSLTLGDKQRKTTIITPSSAVFPISARHSDLYAAGPVVTTAIGGSESTITRVL